MDTMTLAVAGVAALAIILIAIGVATSGRWQASTLASSATPPSRRSARRPPRRVRVAWPS